MKRPGRDELRLTGLGLKARFALAMTASLTVVMALTAYVLATGATRLAERVRIDTISDAVRFTEEGRPYELGSPVYEHRSGVEVQPFRTPRDETGMVYTYEDPRPGMSAAPFQLFVPDGADLGQVMMKMILGILTIVVLVGAGVALWVAGQVTRPVRDMIDDVRQVAKGNLQHKTRTTGKGEIELLARAIDRMTRDLSQAQEAELELSVRERERELAGGVREALLPLATPLVGGYDLGAAFLSSAEFGGDFHGFIERADGRVGLLVCDVSGHGLPAALVGATARSYLRSELEHAEDVATALKRVNRWLAGDVRRGMFVTALYCLLDPVAGQATVACAGHKLPLLRFAAEDGSLRVVHPEGIALGFDQGPVFERRLETVEIPIEPGDRVLLANSAPVRITNAGGRELGEKAFYGRVKKHATLDTGQFLKALRRDLEQYAGEEGLDADVSLVTISREA